MLSAAATITPTLSAWPGPALAEAIAEKPGLVLSFYTFGIILSKQNDNGAHVEYPVEPEQVARVLSAKLAFCTGLMSGDILYVRTDGVQEKVAGYRKGQWTGLYLEGSEEPVRVPLPPLVMVRTTVANQTPRYQVYAIKQRPASLAARLYHAPLPNVYSSGNVCWGDITLRPPAGDGPTSLAEDWATFLGTAFGNHAVAGKSNSHPGDIRQKLLDLAGRGTRAYPRGDLVPVNRTLQQAIEARPGQ